jgi:hypothetical protein
VCVYILALGIWHANCVCSAKHFIVICGLTVSTIYFPRYLINGTIFGNIYWTQKSILIFSTTTIQIISLSKKNSARYYYKCTQDFMYSTCKCQALTGLGFCWQIFEKKKLEISNFTKIRPVGAQLFHEHIWIETTMLTVAYGNSTNAPRSIQTIITLLTTASYLFIQDRKEAVLRS